MQIGEKENFLNLFYLFLTVKFYNIKEEIHVFFRYYCQKKFFFLDIFLKFFYLFKNPYRICKDFLKKRGGKDIYLYGETPLTTMEKIAKKGEITSSDVVFELGAGRGRSSFWLSHFIGCKVIAIEWVPFFAYVANRVIKIFREKKMHFFLQDIFETKFDEATVIYLYGTCLKDEEIQNLLRKFEKLKKNTKIISISYSLSDYSTNFSYQKKWDVSFPWGDTQAYLCTRK